MGGRREHRGKRVRERSFDDIEQKSERAKDDDGEVQRGYRQPVETHRDVGRVGQALSLSGFVAQLSPSKPGRWTRMRGPPFRQNPLSIQGSSRLRRDASA